MPNSSDRQLAQTATLLIITFHFQLVATHLPTMSDTYLAIEKRMAEAVSA